ncbi:MAG: permease prefix domain 1-containing protein [Phycisphaerales bacterium]|nr:permease prefix domain 1-containing protein [Phycisphaerales bacterium]
MSKLNDSNPKLNRRSKRTKVTPSNRDSIASWLDVLTSMLSLPEGHREQVRDELEDHLRSRVDDLLITGTPEPEAIRIAVAELGETAELAKLISHAHTRSNPRRRMMNIALITAAIAGLSIGGISWNNAGGTGLVMPSSEGVTLTVESTERETNDDRVQTFDLENCSMKAILTEIALKFDRELQLSRDARGGNLAGYLRSPLLSSFKGEYTFDAALAAFRSNFSEDAYNYNLVVTDITMQIESYDEFQRGQIETQVHAGPSWMDTDAITQYSLSLRSLLSVKHDLEFASIEVIGDAIVVAAPPNIQIEVVKMMHELEASVMQRQEEQRALNEKEREEARAIMEERSQEFRENQARLAAEFERTVNDLQNEFDAARSMLLASKAKMRMIEIEMNRDPFAHKKEGWDESKERAKVLELHSAYDAAQLELAENEERYNYLNRRILDSQYAHLFKGLE